MRFGLVVFFISSLSFALPQKLSETGLYANFPEKILAVGLRAFTPQYALWTDGATKQRWVLVPQGTQINTADLDRWVFPVGTKLFKEFRFPELQTSTLHRVETRLIERTEVGWEFGSYVWNADESEATLAPAAGIKNVYPLTAELKHDIPSVTECRLCHRTGGDPVLGFDLLQLSRDRDPLALHAANNPPSDLNLDSLNTEGLLSHYPESLVLTPPRIHSRNPEGRAAMGYLHANCANCHQDGGAAGYTELYFRHSSSAQTEAEEPSFLTAVGQASTGFVIPGEESSFRISPGFPLKSAVFYRLQAEGFERMPPRGTKLHDVQAIALIKQWIESLQ